MHCQMQISPSLSHAWNNLKKLRRGFPFSSERGDTVEGGGEAFLAAASAAEGIWNKKSPICAVCTLRENFYPRWPEPARRYGSFLCFSVCTGSGCSF